LDVSHPLSCAYIINDHTAACYSLFAHQTPRMS